MFSIYGIEVDDEEDNLRTRTVAKLFTDLEYTCRFEESCLREEKVKMMYTEWTAKIDSLLQKVQSNLPKIKKAARKRRKAAAAKAEKERRIRMGLDDEDE